MILSIQNTSLVIIDNNTNNNNNGGMVRHTFLFFSKPMEKMLVFGYLTGKPNTLPSSNLPPL